MSEAKCVILPVSGEAEAGSAEGKLRADCK